MKAFGLAGGATAWITVTMVCLLAILAQGCTVGRGASVPEPGPETAVFRDEVLDEVLGVIEDARSVPYQAAANRIDRVLARLRSAEEAEARLGMGLRNQLAHMREEFEDDVQLYRARGTLSAKYVAIRRRWYEVLFE